MIVFPRFRFFTNLKLYFSFVTLRFAKQLWRLFEGVHNVEFTDELDALRIVSQMGECLNLCEIVSYTKCKGQLDKFLNGLEAVMRKTLTKVLGRWLIDFWTFLCGTKLDWFIVDNFLSVD